MELLFERLYAAVSYQARRISRHRDDAEDLAQETLILAFEGLAQLKDPRLLLAWLRKIAWNRQRERLRVSRHAPARLDEFSESIHSIYVREPASPVDQLVWGEMAERLSRCVRDLPENLHQAFQLRALDQLSTRETAQRLGISETAVRTRLRRARILLRESVRI